MKIKQYQQQQQHQFIISQNIFLIIIINLTLICVICYADRDNLNVPCNYLDSINITDGERDSDGNILYDDILYTKEYYGIYDYEFLNETYRQTVQKHIRGCICKIKPCVRMCCSRGEYYNVGCHKNDSVHRLEIDMINEFNVTETIDLFSHFGYVTGKPCEYVNEYMPERYPEDKWILFWNGIVQTGNDPYVNITKNQYCLNPKYHPNTTEIFVTLAGCFEGYYDVKQRIFLPFGMALSVPFLIATFIVYAILPELRNVHGKSLMCYLLGLTSGYSVLAYIHLYPNSTDSLMCRILGYTAYFSFMFAFFWLSVISFDLWWNFRGMKGTSRYAERKKFLIYSSYAWLSSVFMLVLCVGLDASSNVPSYIQPGFGIHSCFLKTNKMTEFLYLYLPIMIIICFNSTFFTLTAIKIRKVQREMSKIIAKDDSRRHQTNLQSEKDKFGLFLRLFIVMGVTWCMEAISWIIDPTGWIFFVFDICNAIQGVVIFALFVFKPKVKQLLIKRWHIWRGIPQPKVGTTSIGTTRSSNMTMTSMNNTEKSLITDVRD